MHALEEAAGLNTRDPRVWFNLGLARQKHGLAGPGLEALRTAHELDRSDAEIALELGRAFIAAQRWMDAVAVLLEATQMHPESATLWLEFAAAQRGLGNLYGMTTSLAKAIELDPANDQGAGFQAAMELAQSALTAKNFGQAPRRRRGRGPHAVRGRQRLGSARSVAAGGRASSRRRRRVSRRRPRSRPIAPTSRTISAPSTSRNDAIRRPKPRFRRAIALDPGGDRSRRPR